MATAFSRSVTVFVDSALSQDALSQAIANVAREGLTDLISSGMASDRYETYVDGRPDENESDVKPGGRITYIFEYIGEAVQFALDFLRERSPVRTGNFLSSFYVATDSGPVQASEFRPDMITVADVVYIFNTQPYDRKIDVQVSGPTPLHFTVPANLYHDCAQALKSAFGGTIVTARVPDVDFPGKYILHKKGIRVQSPGLMIAGTGPGA